MKKILGIIATFTLGLTIGVPMIAKTPMMAGASMININPDQGSRNYHLVYRKVLSNFHIIPQAENNYCGPAAMQSVLLFLNNHAPGQEELSYRLGASTGDGSCPELFLTTLNAFLLDFYYYEYIIPQNYGQTINQMVLFQNAVTQSLQQNIPPLIGFAGRLPWAPSVVGAHIVPITGIEVNSNPELTRYQIAESNTRSFHWFTNNQLRIMFTLDVGSLFLPSHNVFDFSKERINIWVNGAQGNTHSWATPSFDTLTENANLLNEAGITSMDNLRYAKSITLPEFSVNYKWKDHYFYRSKFNLDTKKITKDSSWKKDWFISANWRDGANDEGKINVYFNQTLNTANMNLKFQYRITGNGNKNGTNNSPYVDFDMGNYWCINFK